LTRKASIKVQREPGVVAVVGTILVAAFALEKRGGKQQRKRREDRGNPEWKQRKEEEVNWKHKHPYSK